LSREYEDEPSGAVVAAMEIIKGLSVDNRAGVIRPDTILATTVHPLQVVDEPLPETIHDFRVDLIVTPDEAIWCAEPHRPPGILWEHLQQDKITDVPALAALAARRRDTKAIG
jgi:5-formyltetrahydrofolate cyclo-ligase